ncbi:MAG: RNA-binding S4 domain-containing protein [Fimbriimonadaceae bacterium]|nr:RNA-binding S4 domain-containing protein [Chitinophagales bacterium]
MEFKIKGEYIELMQLLKITGIANTGGHAGILITNGEIKLNGQEEFRKRAKVRIGDVVEYEKRKIDVV